MKSVDSLLNSVTNKKMLVVFPHPDDESVMAGGIIQRAMKLGFEVTVLTLTEGDRGKIFVNGKGRSASEIRRQEMASAMSKLGVSDWIMWKFGDGKLRRTFRWRQRLADFIKDTKPGLIVSYDLSGISGHPDHIVTSLTIRKVIRKLSQVRLIWVSAADAMKKLEVDPQVEPYLHAPSLLLDLSLFESVTKWRAAFAHRSQNLKTFVKYPWWYLAIFSRSEWYSEPDRDQRYKYKYVSFKI